MVKTFDEDKSVIPIERITQAILLIRRQKVMLDSDLAALYEVEAKVLNQAVQRNIERFPADFMFQLTAEEAMLLRSQTVTLKTGRGRIDGGLVPMQSNETPETYRAPQTTPRIRHTVPWRVTSVTALAGARLRVTFVDGTTGEVNMARFLSSAKINGSVFEPLR